MNILLKAATVLDPQSPFHQQKVDIKITDGIITAIGKGLDAKNATLITAANLHISQGWFDSSVCLGEPGYEERETIAKGLDVAAASGFTAIALQPNTYPVLDNSASISFVQQRAAGKLTKLYPVGTLTRGSEGVDLAELYDMQQAGAVAFSDYKKPVTNANLLKIALQYTQGFNGLPLSFPLDKKIAGKGLVHEGKVSTSLGLKGIPNLAESLQITRDIYILEYTGGKLHIPTISTAQAVTLIREAQQKGLNISCSVAVDQLYFTDEVLEDFNTNYKVLPPLRTAADRDALIAGLKEGVITMVTSDHDPLDIEHKKKEFDHATYGTIGLETAFGALLQRVDIGTAVRALTAGRDIFNGALAKIEEGAQADMTLFDPEVSYTFNESHIRSTSKNSPYIGQTLKGKVIGCISGTQIHLNDE